MSVHTYQDSLAQIRDFLNPVREHVQKEAASNSQEMGSSPQVSFKDTAASTPQALAAGFTGKTNQNNLGREQSAEAKDGGMNIETVSPNTDEDTEDFADKQGPQTLDVDQKVVSQGNLGTVQKQEITQEQKTARAERLANSILDQIQGTLIKQANQADQNQREQQPQHNKTAANDDMPQEFRYAWDVANAHAVAYRDDFFKGMLKRAQDESEVLAAVSPEVLAATGGVEALLDKVAMETPESVLPEGADIEMLSGGAEMPVEEAGIGAEGEGAGLEELVAALEEAGVTPEDLQQAFDDVQALKDAGVSTEELAQALTELTGESEVAGDGAAPEAEVPMEVPQGEEKLAADRARVDRLKQILSM